MTSPTHIFFAQFCLAFASIGKGIDLNTENAIICAIGSLTPDLDNSNSWLGRLLPIISKTIERKFGHRTITHSIFAIILLLIANVIIQKQELIAFSIGYISHILIDCTNIQGVKILYPLSVKNAVFPFDTQQPEAYRIKVGSKNDIALGFLFLILTAPFAYLSHKTHIKIIREIQKDINSAVRAYNEIAKDFICFAKLEGINTTTHEHISGEFMIITAEKLQRMLIRYNQTTVAVGKDNFKDDIFTTNILTIPKIKAQTQISPTQTLQNISLSTLSNPEQDSLIYISGKIEFYEPIKITLPPTKFQFIKQTSETKLELNYAPLDFLKSQGLADKILKNAEISIKSFTPIQTPTTTPKTTTQTIEFTPNEEIQILIKTGQNITAGQIIAYKSSQKTQKIELEIEKIQNKINQLKNKITFLDLTLTQDTITINEQILKLKREYETIQELVNKKLKPQASIEEIIHEIAKLEGKKKIKQLEHQNETQKIKTEIENLNIKTKQLIIQLKQEQTKNSITATATGKVKDIKETQLANKKTITITIE